MTGISRALRRLRRRAGSGGPPAAGRSGGRRGIGSLAAALTVSAALLAQTGVTTDASWTDSEQMHAPTVGASTCETPDGAFATRGEGRALSGSLLGIDLDSVAEAGGVRVVNDGDRALHAPAGANPADPSPTAWADPLDVGLLGQAIGLDLGGGMLKLPLDNSTGVLGQYGNAQSDAHAAGAAGYVTETGGIGLEPATGYPHLASLDLQALVAQVNPAAAELISEIADVSLDVGAVTGRAALDGCDAAWNGVAPFAAATDTAPAAGNLQREYLTSAVTTNVETGTVGALVTAVEQIVTALEATVNGLAANRGVLDQILGEVTGLLNALISNPILSLGNISVALTASVDTRGLRGLLTETITDAGGVLAVDLASGTVRIDTAALLAAAYPGEFGSGLNGLPPNTDLLQRPQVVDALSSALTGALEAWLVRVTDALEETIDGVRLHVSTVIALRVEVCLLVCADVNIGTITATVDGSLADLLGGSVEAQTSTDLNLGLLGAALRPIVNGLVNTLLGGLKASLGLVVGTTVEGVLGGLRTLPSTVHALVAPVVGAVSGVYEALYLSGVVQLLVNAQNDPLDAGAGPEPQDWAAGSPTAIADGRYDVAALRLGVLDTARSSAVWLYLGRGSVGPVCSRADRAAGGCAGY